MHQFFHIQRRGCMNNNFVLKSSTGMKPFTIEDAHIAAVHLLFLPDVHAIDLYGSIARDTPGNDVDLVIVVESVDTYRKFVAAVMDRLEPPPLAIGTTARFAAVRATFGEKDFDRAINAIRRTSRRSEELVSNLDLLVMPMRWETYADTLQLDLPYDSPMFVEIIASDARRLTGR